VDFYRTRGGDVRPRLTRQSFRKSWSLAAGTGIRPRVPVVVPIVVVVLAVALGTYLPFGGSRRLGRQAAPWIVLLAYPSWMTIALAARDVRRVLGESRRRVRGGAPWWKDRAWLATGVERPVGAGMRGASIAVALAVAVAYGLFAAGHAAAWRTGGPHMSRPQDWGWSPATAPVVIAAFVLPLLWILVILVPRVGLGRLVVAWPELPQRTGTRVAFHIATSPGGARIDCVRVFLRCVRVRRRLFVPLDAWNARLAWVAEARLPLGAYVGPQSHLRVEFDVPADAPTTDFHGIDAVRWEVLVIGAVGGSDYADSVTVPVYA
jgi:hypothetical protein